MFTETQFPPWWVYLVLTWSGLLLPLLLCLLGRGQRSKGKKVTALVVQGVAALSFLLSIAVFLVFGRMATEVDQNGVRVTFGFIHSYTRSVPLKEIQKIEAVRYHPSDYGGWGIRGRDNDRVLSMAGDQGVRLHLAEEKLLLIGSPDPEKLAQAIEKMREQGK